MAAVMNQVDGLDTMLLGSSLIVVKPAVLVETSLG
jgi:hypothetical protein